MPEELFETDANYFPNDGVWRQEGWDTDDPEGSNWGVEAIDAPDAWDLVDDMQPVAVGVIDSMFDASHEDLSFARVINNPSHPDDKHGTHVSGTIAAASTTEGASRESLRPPTSTASPPWAKTATPRS